MNKKPLKARSAKTATSRTSRKTSQASRASASRADAVLTPQAVVRAGLGAASRMQGEALRIYRTVAAQAEAIRQMTAEAAQTLSTKTGRLIEEGQKIQARAIADAQAQAEATAREVKAFAAKGRKNLKVNVGKTMEATLAQAKEGVTKLEHVFEARVAKTLNTFGVPTAQNVRELQTRMADLQKALNQLNKQRTAARV